MMSAMMSLFPAATLSVSSPPKSVTVPRCPATAALGNWSLTAAATFEPPAQATHAALCHDGWGLHVSIDAEDRHVFSPWHKCNDQVFARSDVLEAFLAPVLRVTDAPQQYFELDTAPSGAMFGALVGNRDGTASTSIANPSILNDPTCAPGRADADPWKSSIHDCLLPCSGAADFPEGLTASAANVSGGFRVRLSVPWGLFDDRFRPRPVGDRHADRPWPTWRINLYRYDYPPGPDANFSNYELSAWSPTHSGSFHVPSAFGYVHLEG